MLLPAAKSNPTNNNDEEDIEVPQEAFSDCEQGIFLIFLFDLNPFFVFKMNECQHLIVEVSVVKVIH
jgi:hypothetical protein